MPTTIAFVTSSLDPAMSADDAQAASALASRGLRVVPAAWDDPAVAWASFDAVILRSPWNYHLALDPFTAWLDRLNADGVRLWNPPAIVRGNLHKRYLLHLEYRGVPIVPTEFVPRGVPVALDELLGHRRWERAVVKPAVSLGAFGTWRVSRAEASACEPQWNAAVQQSDLLVQEWCDEVASHGEWSFVFFGGRFSHAVLKRPAAGDYRVQAHFGGVAEPAEPPSGLIEQAAALLSLVPGRLLYARVDGIARDERLLLMELELVEPNLFFAADPGAADRFADAVVALLGRSSLAQ